MLYIFIVNNITIITYILRKGKPSERVGRKTKGLKQSYDSRLPTFIQLMLYLV